MKRLAILIVMTTAACSSNSTPAKPVDAPAPDSGPDRVERGRYIMNVLGACTFCHTPLNPDGSRDLTRNFAGVDCLIDIDPSTAGFGCVSSRNLTADPTGLINATDDQIKNAFRNGHRTDGKTISPIMPYWAFHNMTDEDADSIVAYIRTIPGVSHTVQANEEPWASINNGGDMTISPYIDPATQIPMPTTGASDTKAMHGRYLAAEAGLCIDCHTPDAPNMGLFPPIDLTMPFQGGRHFLKEQLGLFDPSYPEMINSKNLTPDATGLMGYTKQQVEDAISKGKDKNGNAVCAATHGSQISPYAGLDPADLDDIATYVLALPPKMRDSTDGGAIPDCMGPPVP